MDNKEKLNCIAWFLFFSKHERQTIVDSSLVRLPKSLGKADETLFMTSVEKAKLRNEALLKVDSSCRLLFFLH